MTHVLERIGPALFLLVGLVAFGCGGGSTSTPNNSNTVDVRNGTWKVTSVVSYTGSDSCAALPPTTKTVNDTLCGVDFTAGGGAFRFACDVNLEGEDFTFDCTGTVANLDPCKILIELKGQGTVTDTTFTITTDQREYLTGPDIPCSIYENAYPHCVAHAVVTGAWQDTTGAGGCPADTLSAASERVSRLLDSVLAKVIPAP
jgi:hypothetical protein